MEVWRKEKMMKFQLKERFAADSEQHNQISNILEFQLLVGPGCFPNQLASVYVLQAEAWILPGLTLQSK